MANYWQTKFRSMKLTAFTQLVLLSLLKIPKGEVRSYKQVAKDINCPKAIRAIGTACKNNPFPIIIPCHRVVSSKFLRTHNKNDVGKYSAGGTSRKIRLLRDEKVKFIDSVFAK